MVLENAIVILIEKLSMILIEPNWKKGVGKGIEVLEQ
jgi:hypothetical protein